MRARRTPDRAEPHEGLGPEGAWDCGDLGRGLVAEGGRGGVRGVCGVHASGGV